MIKIKKEIDKWLIENKLDEMSGVMGEAVINLMDIFEYSLSIVADLIPHRQRFLRQQASIFLLMCEKQMRNVLNDYKSESSIAKKYAAEDFIDELREVMRIYGGLFEEVN